MLFQYQNSYRFIWQTLSVMIIRQSIIFPMRPFSTYFATISLCPGVRSFWTKTALQDDKWMSWLEAVEEEPVSADGRLTHCALGRFKNTYELLNLRAFKFSLVNKIHIFQCMGKIFCVEFQRYPLKFHTKYLTHTLKDMIFIQHWNFKSS